MQSEIHMYVQVAHSAVLTYDDRMPVGNFKYCLIYS